MSVQDPWLEHPSLVCSRLGRAAPLQGLCPPRKGALGESRGHPSQKGFPVSPRRTGLLPRQLFPLLGVPPSPLPQPPQLARASLAIAFVNREEN